MQARTMALLMTNQISISSPSSVTAERQRRGSLALELAGVHSDNTVDASFEQGNVLLCDNHRRLAEFDTHQGFNDALANLRGEAERRLVDEIERGIPHQTSADRDHAAFAARQS